MGGAGDTEGGAIPDQDRLRTLTDALMQDIGTLSGQEYVDEYASRKKPQPVDGAGAPSASQTDSTTTEQQS